MTIEYKDSKRIVKLSTDTVNPLIYSDDFTSDNFNYGSANSKFSYDSTNKRMNFDITSNSSTARAYKQLPSTLGGSDWEIRYTIKIDSINATGNTTGVSVAIASNDTGASNAYYVEFSCDSSGRQNYLTANSQGNYSTTNFWSVGTEYFISIKFTASTGKATLNAYTSASDRSAETNPVANSTITKTPSSAPTTLMGYLVVKNERPTNGGSMDGYVKDIQIGNDFSTKPTDVQDNSIIVEKDTARRYWGTNKVTTEEVYNYTTAPSTSNKLTGTPIGYSADAAGVELVSSTFAGKYIKTGKWMLKRVGTLGSNAFMKVQDSSGTVKATSAGVAASGIGTSAFEYVTFTLPTAVELANGDRVYVEYTGADTSGDYLAIGEKHPSTTPTGWEYTIYNLRDVNGNNPSGAWGDDGLPTALVPTATFDLAPASNVTSDSITWTRELYFADDFSSYTTQTSANLAWVPASNVAGRRVNISDDDLDLLNDSGTTNYAVVHDLGANAVSDSKWTLRFSADVTLSSGSNNWCYIGLFNSDQSTGGGDSQNFVSIAFQNDGANTKFWGLAGVGRTVNSGQQEYFAATGNGTLTSTKYYIQIRRLTATSMDIKIYTDASYSALHASMTISGSVISLGDLRYIKFANNTTSGSGSIAIVMDDVKFRNGAGTI